MNRLFAIKLKWIYLFTFSTFFLLVSCAGSDYQKALAIDTEESYAIFIQKYPDNEKYTPQAKEKMDSLAYMKATIANSEISYNSYLLSYPWGSYWQPALTALKGIVSETSYDNHLSEHISNVWKFPPADIERLAAQGNDNAKAELGARYYMGFGIKRDRKKAFAIFQELENRNNPIALYYIGQMYQNGDIGNTKNPVMAEQYFKKAFPIAEKLAKEGYVPAQFVFGRLHFGCQGMTSDAQSIEWFRRAAEQGYAPAQQELGWMYYVGLLVTKDPIQAIVWFRGAALQGESNSAYLLGKIYYNGDGVTQNYAEAIIWFSKAAKQGDAGAQYMIGQIYEYGKGVPSDYSLAVHWYTKAAEQEYTNAINSLEVLCANGHTEVFKWYYKAAEQGMVNAQYTLGLMYSSFSSRCITQDYVKAAEWYHKAAEQGNNNAQYMLGKMYEIGQGVAQDTAQAAEWYHKAAEQGNVSAQKWETNKTSKSDKESSSSPALLKVYQQLDAGTDANSFSNTYYQTPGIYTNTFDGTTTVVTEPGGDPHRFDSELGTSQ